MIDRNTAESGSEVQSMLGALPRRKASAGLNVQLRVMASRESRRRRLLSNPRELAAETAWRARLWLDNLIRPNAVPVTGGLVAALCLFLSIAPAFPMRHTIVDDVPVRLATSATLLSTFSIAAPSGPPEDVVLDVDVDSEGEVVDYMVRSGQTWTDDPVVRKNLESTLVCTRFNPATRFGQPQAGTVRITIRRSALEVRG